MSSPTETVSVETKHVCAEIDYTRTVDGDTVHSDICADFVDGKVPEEVRAFLHSNLEEWLTKGGGSGLFYIGDIEAYAKEFLSDAD